MCFLCVQHCVVVVCSVHIYCMCFLCVQHCVVVVTMCGCLQRTYILHVFPMCTTLCRGCMCASLFIVVFMNLIIYILVLLFLFFVTIIIKYDFRVLVWNFIYSHVSLFLLNSVLTFYLLKNETVLPQIFTTKSILCFLDLLKV